MILFDCLGHHHQLIGRIIEWQLLIQRIWQTLAAFSGYTLIDSGTAFMSYVSLQTLISFHCLQFNRHLKPFHVRKDIIHFTRTVFTNCSCCYASALQLLSQTLHLNLHSTFKFCQDISDNCSIYATFQPPRAWRMLYTSTVFQNFKPYWIFHLQWNVPYLFLVVT